jgi:hypothetical protein
MFKRLIASLICVTFSFTNLQYVQAQASPATGGGFSINQLPVPGTMVGVSTPFAPLALKGLIVNPQKPLEFQFIVDTGNSIPKSMSSPPTEAWVQANALIGDLQQEQLKQQANQLVKYFLAGLTIPEGDLWVNLSPYEKDRMVPSALGQTDLGRDLLAQDYILKQLTASLIYPEKDLGKEFWSRVYAKAQKQFGTTNIPVNTFNKVWILPDQAQVFENRNAAYVTKSTLKVMLDEDYLALSKNECRGGPCDRPITGSTQGRPLQNDVNSLGSQIVREIVIPEITKEVNTGKNFAPLRQIYQALILAKWYKETIQNGLLDAVYTNKNKIAGVNLNDPAVKEQIYNRYLQAYKKGAFNYIKEDPTPDGQAVPRKYFSGGILAMKFNLDPTGRKSDIKSPDGAMISLTVGLVAAGAAALGVRALYSGFKGGNVKLEQPAEQREIAYEEPEYAGPGGMVEATGKMFYYDKNRNLIKSPTAEEIAQWEKKNNPPSRDGYAPGEREGNFIWVQDFEGGVIDQGGGWVSTPATGHWERTDSAMLQPKTPDAAMLNQMPTDKEQLKRTVHVMENHGHAYKWWEVARLQGRIKEGSVLIHVDAHEDMKAKGSQEQPGTIESALSIIYGEEEFIFPAIRNGLIGEVYLVAPKFVDVSGGEKKVLVENGQGKVVNIHKIYRDGLPDFQNETRPVVLDIDMDYFVEHERADNFGHFMLTEIDGKAKALNSMSQGYRDNESGNIFTKEEFVAKLTQFVQTFVQDLKNKHIKPQAVTIATSERYSAFATVLLPILQKEIEDNLLSNGLRDNTISQLKQEAPDAARLIETAEINQDLATISQVPLRIVEMYQETGLTSFLMPLNLKASLDTADIFKAVQEFSSHSLFTVGMTKQEIDADAAMLNEMLQLASNYPILGGIILGSVLATGVSLLPGKNVRIATSILAPILINIIGVEQLSGPEHYVVFADQFLKSFWAVAFVTGGVVRFKISTSSIFDGLYKYIDRPGLRVLLGVAERRQDYHWYNKISDRLNSLDDPEGAFIYIDRGEYRTLGKKRWEDGHWENYTEYINTGSNDGGGHTIDSERWIDGGWVQDHGLWINNWQKVKRQDAAMISSRYDLYDKVIAEVKKMEGTYDWQYGYNSNFLDYAYALYQQGYDFRLIVQEKEVEEATNNPLNMNETEWVKRKVLTVERGDKLDQAMLQTQAKQPPDVVMLAFPGTVNWYIKRLGSKDESVHKTAVHMIAFMLSDSSTSADHQATIKAIDELVIDPEKKLPVLVEGLKNADTFVSLWCTKSIDRLTLSFEKRTEIYINALKNRESLVRSWAIQHLQKSDQNLRVIKAITDYQTAEKRIVARIESSPSTTTVAYENVTPWYQDYTYYNSKGEVIWSETETGSQIGSSYQVGDIIPDQAMLHTPKVVSKANVAENGGIDLNQINVLRKGKTVNVQFDPAQLNALEQGGFQGFTPVIINIQYISSPFQLLGINPPKQEVLAKA